MGKLKRVYATPKKSIMHKGKEVFRTVADARAAQGVMKAYHPKQEHYELVELLAANNTTKEDAVAYFGIDDDTFNRHFEENWKRGKMSRNLKTTKTLFDMANGHEGIFDAKKRRWVTRPRSPDMTALIWWDKTRGGWREGTDVTSKGKSLAPVTNVVVFMPANGREAGAAGDPTFAVRQLAAKTIDGKATEVVRPRKKAGH